VSVVPSVKEPLERAFELHRAGRRKEAESLYRQLISRNERNQRALSALGALLLEAGRADEASRYLERAVSVQEDPRTLTHLGEAYRLLGRLDVAAETFGRILEVAPDFPDVRVNLAITLAEAGVHREAGELLEEALQLGPDGPRLRVALSWVRLRLQRADEAVLHASRAVELAPESAAAHRQLADALDANGEKHAALARYRRAVELSPADHTVHSNLIVAMLSSPEYEERDIYAETRVWAERHGEPMKQHIRVPTSEAAPERRLRIGYVSPDFRAHAVQQFMVPLLENHDASAYEIFLYASVDRPDEQTDWYRSFAGERFRDIRRLDDIRAAELVRNDRIDVLVDLALHGSGGRLRLFACRPAPVQVTWLGYPGTTGLDTMDYRITDPFVDPPDGDLSVYSEASVRLPETAWCYAALVDDLAVTPLPALEAGFVTFGSQNTFRKLHEGVVRLWARVLREVPGSRLLLHAESHAEARLCAWFAQEGIQADRIAFAGQASRRAYLERFQRIDIGLDTFPYNGVTTTLDAAWMGVPVVTLNGSRTLQRGGTSVALNLGLPELVAHTEDEFVANAAALAHDLARLSHLRLGLRARLEASPLGNAPRFARNIENAYRTAWRTYCAGAAQSRR